MRTIINKHDLNEVEANIFKIAYVKCVYFFPGAYLANYLKITRQELFNALESLKSKELIKIEYRIKHKSGCNTMIICSRKNFK